MQKNIFNVYVEMDSQATCDRMKQLCVDNGLKHWNNNVVAFELLKNDKKAVFCFISKDEFYVYDFADFEITDEELGFAQATEAEFIELLKQYKDV